MSGCFSVGRVEITPGFLLLLGVLFYLDDGAGIFPWALIAAGFHELGHVGAAMMFGGKVVRLRLALSGAELNLQYPKILSYGQENLVALAGPMVNLLASLPLFWLDYYLPAAVSLGLGVCNLLPVVPLDGGRVLMNALSETLGPDRGEGTAGVVAGMTIGMMFGLGLIAAVWFANGMLLAGSVWLLVGMLQKNGKIEKKY